MINPYIKVLSFKQCWDIHVTAQTGEKKLCLSKKDTKLGLHKKAACSNRQPTNCLWGQLLTKFNIPGLLPWLTGRSDTTHLSHDLSSSSPFWHAGMGTAEQVLPRALHSEPFSGNSSHFSNYFISTFLTQSSPLPFNTESRFSIQYLRT